ncbi:MAG: Zn-dependent alcohol dehydrogenase [Alphaproteobacteria bacterium]|jgi:Zn-dependent alcohol dehydrogenase|nr:Zn-dependent alcohol dehydrogenase [Alphaproteobacteria bacterium]MDP6563765.1 Zn-dependent alcohol dehydrogenase [Alphaproteobacteria bacterium]MDP6814101.1 Zn-dependent alcohol dehydrogenase [Alphaproteobacteria bacterium]
MKAAVCYEFGQPLVVEDVAIEPPQAGEVMVKLAACAICHSDIHYAEGAWGGRLPAIYGHEAAGIVEQVGPEVTRTAPGDHVVVTLIRSCGDCFHCARGEPAMCEAEFRLDGNDCHHGGDGQGIKQGLRTGAFAEYVVVAASQVVPIPREVPLDSASLTACGVLTGLGAVVNTAKVPVGSAVVVIGTGGVGLNTVQGAALAGARPIIALDLSADKLMAARAFGASDTIDPAADDASARVKELTAGRGADYVFVTVGSVAAIEQGLGLLRKAGALVVVGMPAVGAMARFEPLDLADRSLRILGSKMGSSRPHADIPQLIEHYRQGRLKLDELISGRYPLERINDAIASVNRGEVLRNVIVF